MTEAFLKPWSFGERSLAVEEAELSPTHAWSEDVFRRCP